MDEDGIGLVLARTSELRSKITHCIHKSAANPSTEHSNHLENGDKDDPSTSTEKIGEEDEETESLLDIRDALESLESQLSALQVLQQQQGYEREAALSEIEYSRESLLKKLKEYKGGDLEVIHQATAFAGEAVGGNNDLLLPPYPSRPPCSLFSENGYPSHFTSTHKSTENGVVGVGPTSKTKKNLQESERNEVQNGSRSSSRGLRFFINGAAKAVLTFVGVVSLLTLAGFEPSLTKRGSQFKVFGLVRQQGTAAKRASVECPPGKVLVVEAGETRCIVKERVEIPFNSVDATPDVSYGCG